MRVMELHDNPHFPLITMAIKSVSFIFGIVAIIPNIDIVIRLVSLMGMSAGLWLTVVIHKKKVRDEITMYKQNIFNIKRWVKKKIRSLFY
jgi:hypothetical protein